MLCACVPALQQVHVYVCVCRSKCMICACVHVPQQAQVHVEARGPSAWVSSLLLPRGSQEPCPSFLSLSCRCSSLGSHLSHPSSLVILWCDFLAHRMWALWKGHGQYLWIHLRLKIVLCETPTSLLESCTPYVNGKYLLRNSFSFSHFCLF